ncbi:hypothetical protein CTEN210_08885 [Chaetoceros tenuissimus]|uniref:RING-type domain-containing protein n=1 Tax=Chaetoceros tenuissimus TaxID=426638 RepID=A0AAD3CXH9_9STRA|nr:hypothetical protein CTEN210_08885 [Chaetoceros tenuissimus]
MYTTTKQLVVALLFFAASLDTFVSACRDITVNDGQPWYDKDGPIFNCEWYVPSNCKTFGDSLENFGMTANEACCACGGGTPTVSPSPTTSPYPTPAPPNNDVSSTTKILAVVGAFIGFFIIVGICVKNSSRNSNNNAARSTNLRTRPTQRTPQQTHHAGSSIADERDVRRQFILTNIIHKKVVTKSSQSNDDSNNDSGESVITGTIADNSQSVEIDEGKIIFPHEAIIRERSERIASMRLSLNHDLGSDGDEEQGGDINDKKDDICIETLRSIRSEMNIQLDMDSLDESLYSPRSCPICCEDYVKGDDVAWSKNEECCHAFHTDCIVPWLMDHDDCPMCRCVYVKEGEKDTTDC